MGLYGASAEIPFRKFNGVVFDVDPAELGDGLAGDCQNVDFDGETLLKRRGRVAYNSSAPTASKTWGALAVYPPDGSTRKLLLQAGTAIYEDNGSGAFSSAVGSLTGGAPMDFVPFKDVTYAGNGVDTVRKRDRSGTWSPVSLIAPPGTAPGIALAQTILEAFDSGTWTLSGSSLSTSYATDIKLQGTGCLKLTASANSARGSFVYKAWSSGATVDLSNADSVLVWYYAEKIGITFVVGIATNGGIPGSIDFSNFPSFTTEQKETWVPIRVPLAAIPPASRTASTGLGFKWVDKPSNASYNVSVYFDQAMAVGPLVSDNYTYYYTYATYATINGVQVLQRESNPSAAQKITIQDVPPTAAVNVGVAASGDGTVTNINVYRYRDVGPFRAARLVQTAANANATLVDVKSDGSISLDDTPELVSGKIVPPLASAYAAVNGRLLAGNVVLTSARYPYRIYVSQLDFPENFAATLQTGAEVNDPTVPGWFDLSEKDTIRRIVEFDGMAVIFCDRSIWTLQGSGWDDFNVQKRADVGLDARWAVVPWERLIFFLAADGIRVLAPNRSNAGLFETWPISEPVNSKLRAIPPAQRTNACMGVDELGRLHCSITRSGQTVNDAAVVFDPRQMGALDQGYDLQRPGWTYYTGWGASLFAHLKRGGGDAGQLLAADPTTAKLRYLQRDGSDADLMTDDGSAIAWSWTSRVLDAGPGAKLAWSYVDTQWDAQPSVTVTATPLLDGAAGTDTKTLTLPTTSSGYVSPTGQPPRFAAGTRAHRVALQLSGSHSVSMKLRAVMLGLFRRQ